LRCCWYAVRRGGFGGAGTDCTRKIREILEVCAVELLNRQHLLTWDVDLCFGKLRLVQSTDGGGRWRPFNRGLTTFDVNSLAIASTGRVLYAGTRGGGVFDYTFPG